MPAGAQDAYDLLEILDGNAFLAGDFRQLDTGPRRPSRQIDQKTEPVSGASRITHAFPLKDHTLRIGSDLSKSLIEILKNVVDVFDTDGQPDQFRRQSRVTLLFFAELRVTCARWMERKALGIAHVGEMRKEAEFFDEPLASRLASLNPENDHAPEPVAQHTASRGMGGIVGQPRIADPRHFRVLLEMIGDLQRIGAVPLHAQRQGFQPLQDHPRIVRGAMQAPRFRRGTSRIRVMNGGYPSGRSYPHRK